MCYRETSSTDSPDEGRNGTAGSIEEERFGRRGLCAREGWVCQGYMSSTGAIRLCRDQEAVRQDSLTADSAGGGVTPRVQALEFVRQMRGASQPWLVRCADGGSYVVKFRNNPQHARVLANEMLASHLAQLVGLPVAAPAFVEVFPSLLLSNSQLAFDVGERREPILPGIQFGSRFPGVPSETLVVDFLPDRLLRRVKNLDAAFLGAFVFDKWTCNCDGRQVIFHRAVNEEGSSYSVTLIDQGFCFNDGDWTFPDSPLRGLYPRRLVYEKVRGMESFEPFLSRIENLSAGEVEASSYGIPATWCEPEPDDLARLLEALYARRRILRQAIIDAKNSALAPFPNWA